MPASRTFETVRALRALAALLVILQHAFEVFSLRSGQPPVAWDAGSFGVDIFFVISGFVMVCATQGRPAGPTGAWQFLHRRLLRIVPPYWFWTLAKIGSVLAVPSLALQTKLSWGFVAASFAFIPWNHDNKPVLPVGWTLTHEMTFYLLFTAVLWLRLPLLKSLTPIFAAVAVLGLFRDPAVGPAWWTIANPIIIEFLFGVAIGKLVLSGWTLRPWVASLLLLPFIGVMTLWIGTSAELRWLDWGVPAASLVLGLALLEPVLAPRLPRLPLLLGDASVLDLPDAWVRDAGPRHRRSPAHRPHSDAGDGHGPGGHRGGLGVRGRLFLFRREAADPRDRPGLWRAQ